MKKSILIFGIILLVLTGVCFGVYKIVEAHANSLPVNSVRSCTTPAALPRVLALGDSITHGRVSADYVALLSERYSGRFEFINAGINGHLAYNALQRLDRALEKCAPEIVFILLGTNDVNATLSEKNRERYRRNRELPRDPDLRWYRENMKKIFERLRREDGPRTRAVFSIPPIGEEIDSTENTIVRRYNQALGATAAEYAVPVLPLFERMSAVLEERDPPGLCGKGRYYVEAAVFQYYLLGRSWQETSDAFGFHFTTDCLHFNERAAGLMADLAGSVLTER